MALETVDTNAEATMILLANLGARDEQEEERGSVVAGSLASGALSAVSYVARMATPRTEPYGPWMAWGCRA
jgi:hypothetical protein